MTLVKRYPQCRIIALDNNGQFTCGVTVEDVVCPKAYGRYLLNNQCLVEVD